MDKDSGIKFTPEKDGFLTKEQLTKLGEITQFDIELAKVKATGLLGDLIKIKSQSQSR